MRNYSEAPKISVIIISYKRVAYLREAVISIISQRRIQRSNLEVIVVKDFSNDTLDKFLKTNCDKVLNLETEYNGEKWKLGIEESTGDVICFLDDDDLFCANKIERIEEVFSDHNVDFYHNELTIFKDSDRTDQENPTQSFGRSYYVSKHTANHLKASIFFKNRASFNSSSICVSRKLAKKASSLGAKVYIGWDSFIGYLALAGNYDILLDKSKLTLYRLHNSFTNKVNYSTFLDSQRRAIGLALDEFEPLMDAVGGSFIEEVFENHYSHYKIIAWLFGYMSSSELKRSDFLAPLKKNNYNSVKYRIATFTLGIISLLSKRAGLQILYLISKMK